MATHRGVEPRTFFLNESHEHARDERQGMGTTTQYTSITWQEKGERIAKSFKSSRTHIDRTADPLSRERYFLLSFPEVKLERA